MKKLLLSPLFLAACLFLTQGARAEILPPKVTDAALEVGQASLDDVSLILKLEVENPNSVDVKIESIKADVTITGVEPMSLKSDESVVLKAKSKTKTKIPLNLPWKNALVISGKVLEKKSIPYKIKGTARIAGKETPFEHAGQLPTR